MNSTIGVTSAEEQERDVGRLAAIAGHDQLVARGLLRQPFGRG